MRPETSVLTLTAAGVALLYIARHFHKQALFIGVGGPLVALLIVYNYATGRKPMALNGVSK